MFEHPDRPVTDGSEPDGPEQPAASAAAASAVTPADRPSIRPELTLEVYSGEVVFMHGTHGGPYGIAIVAVLFVVRMLIRTRWNIRGRRRPPRGPWEGM